MEAVQVLETPIKSEGDKKKYRLIKLANGLKALLIRKIDDEDAENKDLAAVSLRVEIGSFDDPPHVQGLAHFLEHMLFMGSEKYPVESMHGDFLSTNGGFTNASTDSEFTNYYFFVNEKAFPEALDIYSSEFIAPLLRESAMQREREAVDSEYQMALSAGYMSTIQILKVLINEAHPASQFNFGNLKTLKEDISDDDLHRELLKLFEKYSSHKMTLAMQSNRTLDEMQELVVKYFSGIKNRSEIVETRKIPTQIDEIFKPQFFNKIHFVKPVTSSQELNLVWPLPATFSTDYKCAPLRYITQVFDNEGEGGLKSYLKDKQLASLVSFSDLSEDIGCSQFSSVKLSVSLTSLGINNIDKILEAIFSFLLMIKETPIEEHRRFYNDLKVNSENDFKFKAEARPMGNVQRVMHGLTKFDDIDILRGGMVYQNFDEKVIVDLIEALNQRKFNIMIVDDKREVFSKTEKWFNVEYDEFDFPEEYQTLWNERKLNPEFLFEKPNPFNVTNFEIFVNAEESTKYPVKIFEDNIYEVYHSLDNKYNDPKAVVFINFSFAEKITSTQNKLYLSIFKSLLKKHLHKHFAHAKAAGYNSICFNDKRRFELYLTGYNEKIATFIEMVIKEVQEFVEIMDEAMFDVEKTTMEQDSFNSLLDCDSLNEECLAQLLEDVHFNPLDLLAALKSIRLEGVQKFVAKLFGKLKIQMLMQGNITKSQALKIVDVVRSNVNCEPIEVDLNPKDRCYQLPLGLSVCRVKSLILNDENSFIANVYQFGPETLRARELMTLLAKILHSKAFDYLRTNEQLGYQVGIAVQEKCDVIGLQVYVASQEHKHLYTEVLDKMEHFMNVLALRIIEEMSDEDFEISKQLRIKKLLALQESLNDELNTNWTKILSRDYAFDRSELSAKITRTLTKSDLQNFYKSLTQPENMRKLSVQVIGGLQNVENSSTERELKIEILQGNESEEENLIRNFEEFRGKLLLYPVVEFKIE